MAFDCQEITYLLTYLITLIAVCLSDCTRCHSRWFVSISKTTVNI